MTELKKCKFCGGEAVVHGFGTSSRMGYWGACDSCEVTTPVQSTPEAAADDWNADRFKPESTVTVRETPIDTHLRIAATLMAQENDLILMGPCSVVPAGVGAYVHYQPHGAEFPASTPLWFRSTEDARAVCAALNRVAQVAILNTRRPA